MWVSSLGWNAITCGRSGQPDLPARLQANAPLNAADPATFYGGDRTGYTAYPALDAAQK